MLERVAWSVALALLAMTFVPACMLLWALWSYEDDDFSEGI